jgi:hypothetical protein
VRICLTPRRNLIILRKGSFTAAVKRALLQLPVKKFKELRWKISQNPEDNGTSIGLSEEESEPGIVDAMLVRIRWKILNAALSEVDAARLSIDEKKEVDEHEVPSLDKFLVNHVSKLEKEVEEAKKNRGGRVGEKKEVDKQEVPSLDKFLVKHVSKLEKEVEEAKKNHGSAVGENQVSGSDPAMDSVPGLGSILVKRMSKLEKEVCEAKRNSCTSISIPLSEKDLNMYDNKDVSRDTLVKKKK